jgi:SAM-dependent methyltransferase
MGETPAPSFGSRSQWRDTAGLDAARARELATRNLEARGNSPDEVATRAAYLDLLALRPGDRVLEVGCGSGVVARDIARRVMPGGRVVGVDTSAELLAIATELARGAGLDAIDFREADGRALSFADGEFDAVLAVTVLAHIADADRAIHEMVRVARRGGRVAVFDFDGDSLLVSHPDRALTRRILAAMSDHSATDSWLVRRLPGVLVAAGLRDVRTRAFMPLEQDATGFYARLVDRAAAIALDTGAVTRDEHDRWLDLLRAERAAGRTLGGRLHLFCWGQKP